MADEEVDSFLKMHKDFKYNEGKTRVICIITGHELPCNLIALESYMNGKKYQQLTRKGTCDIATLEKFKEYLIPSRRGKQKLYCTITKKQINNIPHQIENHVTGRKFQRDLKLYLQKASNNETSAREEDEEMIEDADDADDAEVENAEDGKEESIPDDEPMAETDPEFVGGIWLPPGTQFDSDENMASEEKSNEKSEIQKTNKKNKLKRKLKDNKKRKLSNPVSQKKKR